MDVTIIPEEGNMTLVAQLLLKAAEHPYQVRAVSSPQAGFIVPEKVFETFEQLMKEHKGSPTTSADPEQEAPAPKRRGRPRKHPVETPEAEEGLAEEEE